MFARVNNTLLMIGLTIAGLGLVTAPMLFGPAYAAAAIASTVIGAVMIMVGVGIGFGSTEWWSRFALGIGTWSMVSPFVLGFHHDGAAFWTHVVAGFMALIVGIAGHELIVSDGGAEQERSAGLADSR
jgi:hypothetical protein